MQNNSFPLSLKYIDFINTTNVTAEFLEGTTASGKTTVGAGVKFMRMVSASRKKLHVIAAKTTGKAEETIIQQDNGILDLHRNASYYGNGDKDYKLPHIKFEGKIIYILGYDRRDKWEMVLGAQFGCVYIDEINTADIEFVREISTRNEYLLATLNPDDPTLPVYDEFINRSRPFNKYAEDVPTEIMRELNKEPVPNWRYWFFSFRDNLSLSAEDIEKKIASAPKGTKLYKNKILGLRGKATGLVFPNFDKNKHTVSAEDIIKLVKSKKLEFKHFTAGLDTAYSQRSSDTIAMSFCGITADNKLIVLDEKVYNNATLQTPFAPSDTVMNFVAFLERNREKWGFAKNVFIDSADQATITELNKYKRENPCLYIFNAAHKKVRIIDRINLQLGWLHSGHYLACKHCTEHIKELESYCWKEDKDSEPEDRNDHTINSVQYAWIPYRGKIGIRANNIGGNDENNG